MTRPPYRFAAVAAALALAGCGGGGGGSTSPAAPATPAIVAPTSGVAVDGYLSGATVICDTNGNGVADTGEATTTTSSSGAFTFSPGCTAPIVVRGGTNVDTGFAFNGVLKAPASATVVTPLTTLMVAANLSPAQVATAFGLPSGTDVTRVDPANGQNTELLKKTLAAQQVLQQLAGSFATLSGSSNVGGVYERAAAALGAALAAATAPFVSSNGNVDTSVVAAVAQTIATQLAVTVTAADKAAIADQVVKQSEAFLAAATPAELLAAAQQLQAPTARVDVSGGTNYLALANDALLVNGVAKPLASFAGTGGVSTTGLSTLGLAFQVVGAPAIDTVSGLAMSLTEVGGEGRKLQLMIDKVHIVVDTQKAVHVEPASDAKVYVYGHTGNGTDITMSITDLTFKPIAITNNTMSLSYVGMVDKVLASSASNVQTTAQKFASITGTFDVAIVVSALNIRFVNSNAFDSITVPVTGLNKSVTGSGIQGRLVIQ